MKQSRRLGVLAGGVLGVLVGSGCGDNSKSCGPGTGDEDQDGECEVDPGGTGVVCSNGTRLDPVSMDRCVPDPSLCGSGTVLVNGTCQDPTAGLMIDLEEGPEPNGLEPDATPAGEIVLGGDGFVIHGCVTPLDDATADLDAYLLTVSAPALLDVVADGVGGLAAGFHVLSTATTPPLASYARLGLAHGTDLAHRQLFLPAAGTYRLILTDTRTLLPLIQGGTASPPAGNPDGTSCYYVTLTELTPAPQALDPAVGDTGMMFEALELYTGAGLDAFTTLTAQLTTPHAQPALIILNGATLQLDDDGTASLATLAPGDTPLVVADFVYNYSLFAAPYRLTVQ